MKILLLSENSGAPTSPQATLAERLIAHWTASLHEVTVITAATRAPQERSQTVKIFQPPRRWLGRATRLLPGLHRFSFVQQQHRGWFEAICAELASGEYDVMISFSNPYWLNAIGLRAAERFPQIRWIAHYSDPIIDSPYKQVSSVESWKLEQLERKVLETADRVVFCNFQLRAQTLSRHSNLLTLDKAPVLPHSHGFASIEESEPTGPPHIVRHIGSLYGPRRAESVIGAFASAVSLTSANFVVEFCGQVSGRSQLATMRKAEMAHSEWLRIRPAIPYADSLNLMTSAHLLISIDSSVGAPVFLPSKLIEYVGARRPVIVFSVPGSPSWRLAGAAGFYKVSLLEPTNMGGLVAEALNSIASWAPNEGLVREYSASRVGSAWLSKLEEITR